MADSVPKREHRKARLNKTTKCNGSMPSTNLRRSAGSMPLIEQQAQHRVLLYTTCYNVLDG